MNKTEGTIYIVSEIDVISNHKSDYYKCGIVRDGSDRDSRDRLLEHQTGNPRQLYIVDSFKTPFVEPVETATHYRFAKNRVKGEWLKLDKVELEKLKVSICELITEVKAHASDFELADLLKKQPSNGKTLALSTDAEFWYVEYKNFKAVQDSCDEVLEDYDNFLHTAIKKGIDVSPMAKIQKRSAPKVFDEKLFSTLYPELHKKYTTSTTEVKGSFRLSPDKNWVPDISTIGTEHIAIIADLKESLKIVDHSIDYGFILHEKHLAVLEIQKYAQWKCDIANIKLRVLTGDSDGIEGICSWKRKETIKNTFDKYQLQIDYPEEYQSCITDGKETEALIVQPMHAGKVDHIA
jgi:hypothetical protein